MKILIILKYIMMKNWKVSNKKGDSMDKKIIFKIIFVVLLFVIIVSFDYYIYMFIKSGSNSLPHSVDYVEKNIFDVSKDYVNSFFYFLENGNYEEAYNMLHQNSKMDLFDSNLNKFIARINSKYFSEEFKYKTFAINNSSKENINEGTIFHAYYEVKVNCSSESLKNTSDFYKDRNILVDVVKSNGEFKIVLNFEE